LDTLNAGSLHWKRTITEAARVSPRNAIHFSLRSTEPVICLVQFEPF
jgi:hypothetical protein